MLRVGFVTLFPEMIFAALRHSIIRRAEDQGLVRIETADPRDYCYDRHRKVDDTPYGGGPGMLIKAEPVALALESLLGRGNADEWRRNQTAVVLTSPTGRVFTQVAARELAEQKQIAFLCGHYEGFDHRIETQLATHVFSIGDFVLTNGELPALVMADAAVRLIPGVLGSSQSLDVDSFSTGLLSAPNYTKPEEWRGERVPDVLLSGDHGAIARWRRAESLRQTMCNRPDLLALARLEKRDLDVLSS